MKPAASSVFPWLMGEATEYLELILDLQSRPRVILETGAGGSTVFFARRCERLISYEHNAEWAAASSAHLREAGLSRIVEGRLRPLYPTAGLLSADKLQPLNLAFIDGRGRVRSVIDVVPFIKPGGWLILDDSDRPHYAEARRVADAAASLRVVFRSGPDETTFWRIK